MISAMVTAAFNRPRMITAVRYDALHRAFLPTGLLQLVDLRVYPGWAGDSADTLYRHIPGDYLFLGDLMRRLAVMLATLLIATGLASLASPANADSQTFTDGKTTRSSMDIHRVRVINGRRLTVRVVVDDLQRRAGQGGVSVWIDTNAGRRGPEFGIGSGLVDSDWHISRASGWRFTRLLHCPVSQRLLFKRDTIVFTTGRRCLGRYGKVRVGVTTAAGRWGRTVDHSPRRHAFHRWVRRS